MFNMLDMVFMITLLHIVAFILIDCRKHNLNSGLQITEPPDSLWQKILLFNGEEIFRDGALYLIGFGEGVAFFRSVGKYITEVQRLDSVIKVNTFTGEVSYVIPESARADYQEAEEEFFLRAEGGELGELLYEDPYAQGGFVSLWKFAGKSAVSTAYAELLWIRGNSFYMKTFRGGEAGMIEVNVSHRSVRLARKSWLFGFTGKLFSKRWLFQDGGYDT